MADQVKLSRGSQSYKTMETSGAARDTGNRFGAVEITYRGVEKGERERERVRGVESDVRYS